MGVALGVVAVGVETVVGGVVLEAGGFDVAEPGRHWEYPKICVTFRVCPFLARRLLNSQSLSFVQTPPLTQVVLPDLLKSRLNLLITNKVKGRLTILLRRTGRTFPEAVDHGQHERKATQFPRVCSGVSCWSLRARLQALLSTFRFQHGRSLSTLPGCPMINLRSPRSCARAANSAEK